MMKSRIVNGKKENIIMVTNENVINRVKRIINKKNDVLNKYYIQ